MPAKRPQSRSIAQAKALDAEVGSVASRKENERRTAPGPGDRYRATTTTASGRAWLMRHREAHDAFHLAMQLLEAADELSDPLLDEERRREAAYRVRRLVRADRDFDGASETAKRRAMIDALDYGALRFALNDPNGDAIRPGSASLPMRPDEALDLAVASARALLAVYHLDVPPEHDEALRLAVSLWPTKKKGRSEAVFALAGALGCAGGTTSAEAFRVQLAALRKA